MNDKETTGQALVEVMQGSPLQDVPFGEASIAIPERPKPRIRPAIPAPSPAKQSRLNWAIKWTAPEITPAEAKVWDVSLHEAERRLAALVRTAAHHAAVSGVAEITIRVTRSSGKMWARK